MLSNKYIKNKTIKIWGATVQFWVGRERLEERGGGFASLDGGRGFHVEPFFLGSTVGLLLQDSDISSLLTSLQSNPVKRKKTRKWSFS
jgi:hypothetical protein